MPQDKDFPLSCGIYLKLCTEGGGRRNLAVFPLPPENGVTQKLVYICL
jgi:hypothetical protein